SVDAFRSTLDSMIASAEKAKAYYERIGKVPIYKKGQLPDVEDLEAGLGEELDKDVREAILEQELTDFLQKGLFLIDRKELRVAYIEDLDKDLALLRSIRDDWFSGPKKLDPKIEHFRKLLEEQLQKDPGRKVVIFTEFADTAA